MSRCADCTHYSPVDAETGECRESPPKIFVLPVRTLNGDSIGCRALFPVVHGVNAWCGYFEEDDKSLDS